MAKFVENLGYQVEFCAKYVFNNVRHFYFMKKSCLVLQLHHFKVQGLDFPMKIDNLATLLLNCCEKLFL